MLKFIFVEFQSEELYTAQVIVNVLLKRVKVIFCFNKQFYMIEVKFLYR